ncbi:MAG TPA: hypothetical protein VF169_08380 [Albitalea sp.]|uniref:hypothetical protein n=1 Tax=Piscinibacter sp. TaxID=1903157 RepID=UPI002ED4DB04
MRTALVTLFSLVLAACGGGGGDPGAPAPTPAPQSGPTDAQRIAAATSTAENNAECNAIRPFYWELGDRSAKRASGSVGGTTYTATTAMGIASSSKWIYSAYVLERRAGAVTATDVRFLSFVSGYASFRSLSCTSAATVDACLNTGNNGQYTPASDGRFDYGGGHMQRHAHDLGLGSLSNAGLATEVQSQIGDFGFSYSEPQPAGGVFATADAYAAFLRKMLSGQLQIASQLGTHAVCTNPLTCATADYTPIPSNESWHYSLGHWVEDDHVVGDGAFSSAGAFGFYPWIDSSKTWYGVIARMNLQGGYESARCGRLIRKAWVTGAAV